jgi:prepilin-type N-terminal cleavage/methylation domain-containing protein
MKRRAPGFSLPELMVAVTILGVLSGLMIDAGLRDWRREQVNAVVVELAGWLESVRRAALKGSSCAVTLTTTNGTLAGGAELARGVDVGSLDAAASTIVNNCRSSQPLRIPSLSANQRFHVEATQDRFVFTPAGTVFPAPSATTPIVIRVSLADGIDPERCVQLEGLMGLISVGRVNGSHCDTANDRI